LALATEDLMAQGKPANPELHRPRRKPVTVRKSIPKKPKIALELLAADVKAVSAAVETLAKIVGNLAQSQSVPPAVLDAQAAKPKFEPPTPIPEVTLAEVLAGPKLEPLTGYYSCGHRFTIKITQETRAEALDKASYRETKSCPNCNGDRESTIAAMKATNEDDEAPPEE
jgi:hypothetical protein